MHANYEHGEAGSVLSKNGRVRPTVEYLAWINMRRRCQDPTSHSFADYGGRGIRVCDEWGDYRKFLAHVGRRPSIRHSIDRIDNDGHYEPSNVRWALPSTQSRNRRNIVLNETAVVLIRALAARGSSSADIGAAFGVMPSSVSRIVRRERWRDALDVIANAEAI